LGIHSACTLDEDPKLVAGDLDPAAHAEAELVRDKHDTVEASVPGRTYVPHAELVEHDVRAIFTVEPA
jgi:hypothetical protein